MVETLRWQIVLRAAAKPPGNGFPRAIVTAAPALRHENMPDEVGLLLPTSDGPKAMIDAVAAGGIGCGDAMLGLFLASPFLNVALEAPRLAQAGVGWIVNLPSVEQQDEDFAQQLADVGLDRDLELERLSRFRAEGFGIAVIVAGGPGATAAAACDPAAMIVLPRIADFAAGFPSLRQRGAAAQAVAEAARAAGWSGLLLGLGEVGEAGHEGLWPERLDGLVCRPQTA